MRRVLRQSIASAATALVAALVSLSVANAQSAFDSTPPRNWDEVFAHVVGDQTAVWKQSEWQDFAALGYAKSKRSDAAAVRWLPQPLPAVDGINGKIAGFGGGADHTNGFYGATGSLSVPLAHQWGAQIDGGVGSLDGSGWSQGAGHLFWRDPSIGLLGAYGSYLHWNGIGALTIPRIGVNVSRFAAEGEYYWSRWNFHALAGDETVHLNIPNVANLPGLLSIPNRFFDSVSASYYVTDNFELSIGHLYTFGRNALTLDGEYGFALGGGRMASLFVDASLAEGGNKAVLGGVRFYFGQRDKTLIARHRQDDPVDFSWLPPEINSATMFGGAGSGPDQRDPEVAVTVIRPLGRVFRNECARFVDDVGPDPVVEVGRHDAAALRIQEGHGRSQLRQCRWHMVDCTHNS